MRKELANEIIKEIVNSDRELDEVVIELTTPSEVLTDDMYEYIYSQIERCEECGNWFYIGDGCC